MGRAATIADAPPEPDRQAARHDHAIGLDALRGIAAVLVVVYHVGLQIGVHPARYGYLAVDFFFMLSGFVIAYAYEPRLRAGTLAPLRFGRLRLIRLYPMVLLSLAIAGILRAAGFELDAQIGWSALLALLLLPNLATDVFYPVDNPLWSLAFELLANGLHAVLLWRLPTWGLAVLATGFAIGLWLFTGSAGSLNSGWGLPTWPGGFLRIGWGYLLGIVCCRLVAAGRPPVGRVPGWVAPILLLLMWWPTSTHSRPTEWVLVVLVFPVTLLAGLNLRPRGAAFTLARALGLLSYPLYTLHMPLLQASRELAWRLDLDRVIVVETTGVSLVFLALAVERFYERPVRAWARRRFDG